MGSFLIQNVVQLIMLIVLSRFLSPVDFGIVSIFNIFMSFISVFIQFGIPESIVQNENISKNKMQKYWKYTIISNIFVSFLLLSGTNFLSDLANIEVNSYFFILLSIVIILNATQSLYSALLQKQFRYTEIAFVEAVSYFLGYGLIGMTLGILYKSYFAILIANLTYYVIKTASFVVVYAKSPIEFKEEYSEVNTSNNVDFFKNRLLSFFTLHLDNMIIAKLIGTSQLGVYSRMYQLISLPSKVFGVFTDKILFSLFSNVQKNKSSQKETYFTIKKSLVILSIPVVFLMVLYSEILILILLGKQWVSYSFMLSIFSLSVYFRTVYKLNENILNSNGLLKSRMKNQILYLVLVLFSSLILSPFGLIGIVVGITFSIIVYNFAIEKTVNNYFETKRSDFFNYLTNEIKLIVIYSGSMLLVFSMKILSIFGMYLSLALSIILTFIYYYLMYKNIIRSIRSEKS